jgi:hypothetical protein
MFDGNFNNIFWEHLFEMKEWRTKFSKSILTDFVKISPDKDFLI